jgi:hypothetical protein
MLSCSAQRTGSNVRSAVERLDLALQCSHQRLTLAVVASMPPLTNPLYNVRSPALNPGLHMSALGPGRPLARCSGPDGSDHSSPERQQLSVAQASCGHFLTVAGVDFKALRIA